MTNQLKSINQVRLAATAVAGLIFAAGLLTFVRPLAERLPERVSDILLPIDTSSASFLLLGFGLALMYLGFELLQRKRLAWWLGLGLSTINLVLHAIIEPQALNITVSALVLGALVVCRPYFSSRIHSENIRRGLIALGASVGLALTYGVLGFWYLDQRDFGVSFSLGQSIIRTLRSYLLLGNNDLKAGSLYGRWFLHSLAIVGCLSLAYGLFSLFRPLRYRLRTLPHERLVARQLLEKYGGETDDFFKLWPADKSYFFSKDGRAFVAYGVANGVAMCFAGPVGAPRSIASLLSQFQEYCLSNGWQACFGQTSDRFDKDLSQAGFKRALIGADAVIDLDSFLQTTANKKYFRQIANRFARLGYTTALSQPPHPSQLIHQTRAISTSWLSRPGRKQWRFFTGYFSGHYLQQTALFTASEPSGRLMAFTNLLPSFKRGEATVDLMRQRGEAPTNLMDFLFLELFKHLRDEGYTSFNLGISVLAAKDFAEKPSDKLLSIIYGSKQNIISFKGLHRYKAKFEPRWEPRYLYYQGTGARLPQIGLAAAQLIKY